MAEAIIYPGMNNEDLESLQETLGRKSIKYSISPAGNSGEYRSMIEIYGEMFHNSPTLLRYLNCP